MNKQSKLLYGQALFAILIIVAFGLIIINEKKTILLMPKVQEKIDSYIEEKYSGLDTNKGKIILKNDKYMLKMTSNDNKSLYFYIIYNNNKITDTYKKDYLEGNSLLNKIKKDIENDILKKLKINSKVEIDTKLNDFTDQLQEKIKKESNLSKLKIFYLELEIIINNWDSDNITKDINNIIKEIYSSYNPKYINIIITNNKDITESYKINNLNNDFINNDNNTKIIDDIINNKDTELLKNNKITYKRLN